MIHDQLKFSYSWRNYQKRVLDAIDEHLDDSRLHIVAAPGAGKTTLGIEVFKRLGKPALVLSPTRVIRDQWIGRLSDFVDEDVSGLDWVSNDLASLKIFNSITYQAVHAKVTHNKEELEEPEEEELLDERVTSDELNHFVNLIKASQIGVIILDEAHHLKAEWWKALDKICAELPELILVSLTATPPYDSRDHEWSKYEALCGPIDEEISVPELVKAGTLCAHQDYIWAVDASSTEKQKINEYEKRVVTLCDSLFQSQEFESVVVAHPWLLDTSNEQEIIKQPELVISILSFLQAKNIDAPRGLLKLLDLNIRDIPKLDRRWWQTLVEAVLFSTSFTHSEEGKDFISSLKKRLRASELLRKRELSIEYSRRLNRSLSQSLSKVGACIDIHKLEYDKRSESLRQVILTDYIRDEALRSEVDTGSLNLGAWPIFKGLTETSNIPDKLALLTGRLSILQKSLVGNLERYIDITKCRIEPVDNLEGYVKVTGPLNLLTSAFTHLLLLGDIYVLVGTKSLLGEGWDAPVVNSLILASAVGSFMLTNQMRGRAIRIDKENPEKISSVWHLVAIDHKSNYYGWSDYYDLCERFNTFVGLSEKDLTIESGMERLNATKLDRQSKSIKPASPVRRSNIQMRRRFSAIDQVETKWKEALTLDEAARVVPSVETPRIPKLRTYHITHTLKYLLIQLGAVFSAVVYYSLYLGARTPNQIFVVVMVAFCLAALYTLPKVIRAVRILLKHLPVDGSLKQIGLALAYSLTRAGLIESSWQRIKVNTVKSRDGSFYVALTGCTFYESSLFADCMREVLGSIESPRYMVRRMGEFMGMDRVDYHAVPLKLGVKKNTAMVFYKAWCKYVGPTELIYTRSDEGRERLVKARIKAFSAVYENKVKRQNRWQ